MRIELGLGEKGTRKTHFTPIPYYVSGENETSYGIQLGNGDLLADPLEGRKEGERGRGEVSFRRVFAFVLPQGARFVPKIRGRSGRLTGKMRERMLR